MNTVTQKLTRLKIFTAVSFILTAALGTACHFAFDFFGQSRLIAPFVPVNESTWEHLKLLFFPFLLLLVLGCFAGIASGNSPASNRNARKMFLSCYWDGAAFGEIHGMTAVIVLFYGINGILGFNIDWINIAIYYISVLYAHFTFYRYASQPYYNTFSYHKPYRPVPTVLPLLVLISFTVLFAVFTFYPPHIGLFADPQNGTYGLPASFLSRYSYPSKMTAL